MALDGTTMGAPESESLVEANNRMMDESKGWRLTNREHLARAVTISFEEDPVDGGLVARVNHVDRVFELARKKDGIIKYNHADLLGWVDFNFGVIEKAKKGEES